MDNKTSLLALKKFEEMAAACNRCGFCTSYCPTYKVTGNEAHSPRGRVQMFRALIEGKVSNPTQAKESVDTCLLCGECTSICFSEVPTARLMVEARHFLNQTMGVPKFLQFFLGNILPYPRRYSAVLRISFWAKNLGVSWILRKSGFLIKFFPALDAADSLLERAPFKFLLDYPIASKIGEKTLFKLSHAKAMGESKSIPSEKFSTPHIPKLAYMPVCGSQYLNPGIGLATLKIFEKLKLEMVIPETICCGLPATSYGMNDQARSMARENITRFERGGFEAIVVDDSSCATHLKNFPTLCGDDPAWLKRAHDVSQKVRDLSSTFLQRGLKDHLKFAAWEGGPVAFHDPCKAQYGQRLTNPPRELLAAIPRLQLVPIAEADQCCGGAGTYSLVHPDFSEKILEAKVKNIMASRCKIVVTSSASCLVQLAAGLRRAESNIEALHLSEFLIRAIEKRR